MRRGDTFLMPAGRENKHHLWIVSTDSSTSGEVVVVSVSTPRYNNDQTVLLAAGDHPFIRHPSCIRYDDARIMRVSLLEAKINEGEYANHIPCSDAMIDEIEAGLKSSDRTPNKILKFLGELRAR